MRVAITIDTELGGAHALDPLQGILASLGGRGVPATFFVQGAWARLHPEALRQVAGAGHLIGNHSDGHLPLVLVPASRIVLDARQAERAIEAATGVSPRPFFRCPYGAGGSSDRVRRILASIGYRHIGWTSDGSDWRPGTTAEGIRQRVMASFDRTPDAVNVVLLHSWPAPTPVALNMLLADMIALGAEFVRCDHGAVLERVSASLEPRDADLPHEGGLHERR